MTPHGALRRIAEQVPARWRLPVRATFDLWADIEPEARHLARIGPGRGIAVDVGANYGFYSFHLARIYRRVVAFEPNPHAAAPLKAWRQPAVTLHEVALSDAQGSATLRIPTVQGRDMSGWASLDAVRIPEAHAVSSIEVRTRTLDSYELDDVGFLKIDVEGHELRVLRGARATVDRWRPHLLVELGDPQVERLLATLGYRRRSLEELAGARGASQNAIFTPDR